MTEVSPDQLKQAVEAQHGGKATFVQSVPLREMRGEQLVWEGTVQVFDLAHQPDGHFRAYAWSHEGEGGKRRFFAMLHGGPINGPREAVRAVLVAEARTAK